MKKIGIFTLAIGTILLTACNDTDIGIIGGADGPTSIFVSEQNEEITLIKSLTPTGFAGSSFNRIELYSNGDVYWIQYDATGFDYENIVKNTLVATNATDIEMFEDEGISIIGNEVKAVEDINVAWLKINA